MRKALHVLRKTLLLAAVALIAGVAPAAAQSETTEYYGTDAVGSVRIIFNASGTVLGRQDYDPFGREILAAWGVPPEHFAGETSDSEAQQAYFHAREFQNRTGRFTAVDPVFDGISEPQRWNRYAYALNNPVRFTDPSGLDAAAGCPDQHLADGTIVHIDECDSTITAGGGSIWDDVEWLFLHTVDTFTGTEPVGGDEIVPTGHAYTPSSTVQAIGTAIVVAAVVAPPIARALGTKAAGKVASKIAAKEAKVAYHYTFDRNAASIKEFGLFQNTYATTDPVYSSAIEAQRALALNPADGPRNTLVTIDLNALEADGYVLPNSTTVESRFTMPGGGTEMLFPYPIPSAYVTSVLRIW
jgi:RHS repeat-associated protein